MTTYYVRESGRDSNDGLSPMTAWATLAKASAELGTDDMLIIGGGTYADDLFNTSNGLTIIGDYNGTLTGDPGWAKFPYFKLAGLNITLKWFWTTKTSPTHNTLGNTPVQGGIYLLEHIRTDNVGIDIYAEETGTITLDNCAFNSKVDCRGKNIYVKSSTFNYNLANHYFGEPTPHSNIIKIKNCIFKNLYDNPAESILSFGALRPATATFDINYNSYYNPNGIAIISTSYGDEWYTIEEWQADPRQDWSGYNLNSIEVDPKFKADNVHIEEDSPCIDAGVIYGLDRDIDNGLRPLGDQDIGCDEWNSEWQEDASYDYLFLPEGVSQRISREEGRTTIGQIKFRILDKDGIVTRFIKENTKRDSKGNTCCSLIGKTIQLMGGYTNITEGDFVPLFTGVLKSYELSEDGTAYAFVVADVFRRALVKDIFRYTGDYDTPILVSSEQGSYVPTKEGTVEKELLHEDGIPFYRYLYLVGDTPTGEPAENKTWRKYYIGLGYKDSTYAGYEEDEGPDEGYGINPLTLALCILMTTKHGGNDISGHIPYDMGIDGFGLGISGEMIDVAGFEKVRDQYLSDARVSFQITGAKNAKSFLEGELFKPFNLHPILDGDGKWSVGVGASPETGFDPQNYEEFTDGSISGEFPNIDMSGNIIGRPSWGYDSADVINEISIHYDWNLPEKRGEYYFIRTRKDELSQVTFDNTKIFTIKSQGIKSRLGGENIAIQRERGILKRYKDIPFIIKCRTFFNRNILSIGDKVIFSHKDIPDLSQSEPTRGIYRRLMTITRRIPNYKQGYIEWELMDEKYALYFNRLITGDDFPDYPDADDETKLKYMFICGDSGNFSNGDPGHSWWLDTTGSYPSLEGNPYAMYTMLINDICEENAPWTIALATNYRDNARRPWQAINYNPQLMMNVDVSLNETYKAPPGAWRNVAQQYIFIPNLPELTHIRGRIHLTSYQGDPPPEARIRLNESDTYLSDVASGAGWNSLGPIELDTTLKGGAADAGKFISLELFLLRAESYGLSIYLYGSDTGTENE